MADAITKPVQEQMDRYSVAKAFGSKFAFPNPQPAPNAPANECGPQTPSEPQKTFDGGLPNPGKE